jgi:hypothetical protein
MSDHISRDSAHRASPPEQKFNSACPGDGCGLPVASRRALQGSDQNLEISIKPLTQKAFF